MQLTSPEKSASRFGRYLLTALRKGNHNIYQFVDEELEEIDSKIRLSRAKTVALSYHGVRMNTDAVRFVHYKKTGKFPSITGLTGVASAKAVLGEDTSFPISRQTLLRSKVGRCLTFQPTRGFA